MLEEIYYSAYGMPYWLLAVLTAAILVASGLCHALLSARAKRIVGIIASACVLLIILYVTMLGRAEPETGLVPMPGYSISRIFDSYIYLRMVLMNIFIFVPFGAFMTLALSGVGKARAVMITLITGLVLTIVVEALQYLLNLGCAETDDVICNFAGVFIGVIPCLVAYRQGK